MSVKRTRIFLIGYIILAALTVDSTEGVVNRIQRFHSREITAKVGDTVKLQWKYNIDDENRNEELKIFYCGYRLKGFSKTSNKDPPIIPLAVSVEKRDFFSISDKTKSREIDMISMLRSDDLGLGKNLDAFMDRNGGGRCTMNLQKVSHQLDKVEEFVCELQYRAAKVTEKLVDGRTKIVLNTNNNIPKPCDTKKGQGKVVRGEIFLGAILFDILLMAVVLSASLIWNRKEKGYSRVNTGIKKKKKKKKKSKEKGKDLEKGKDKNEKKKGKNSQENQKKSKPSGNSNRSESRSNDRRRSRSPRPPKK